MRNNLPFEAIIVGLLTILVFYTVRYIFQDLDLIILLFLSGALLHLTLEFAGLNESWCRTTFT